MSEKRRRPPRQIEASRIVLRDALGKVRIVLDAGGDNGFACINLFAKDGRNSVVVGTQPNGVVVMSFNDANLYGMLTLSRAGITLRSPDGRLAVSLGRIFDDTDSITVFRDGRPVWRSPSTRRPKKTAKSKPRRKS
jgi:hypothetical protein